MSGVSVIIAVYNCSGYIDRCLESVFSQTLSDYEVIVIDGGSDDGTVEKLGTYQGRIRLIVQTGRGVANARNEGIKASKGKYIAILDGDDYWLPEKLEVQVEYMESHPEVGMVFSDVYDLYPDGALIGPYLQKTRGVVPTGYIFERLLEDNFITTITTLIRRTCFDRVGLFDETLLYAEDTEMWLRVAKEYEIGFIDKPLAVYFCRESSRISQFAHHYPVKIRIVEKALKENPWVFEDDLGKQGRVLAKLHFKYGYRHFEVGRYDEARKAFSRALHHNYNNLTCWLYYLVTYLPPAAINILKKVKKAF